MNASSDSQNTADHKFAADDQFTADRDANSVQRLREREKARSTRPFVTRGSRLTRCEQCLLATHLCVCDARPEPTEGTAVCLVYFRGEVFKPSNSGRLIADVLADNHAFLWARQQPEPELKALLNNPDYAPVLIFPTQYAAPERCIEGQRGIEEFARQCAAQQQKPLLVFLDGTWREARKMFRSDWLQGIPVLGIEPEQAAQYGLREAFHEHQLGTAEVAIQVLAALGDSTAAQQLADYFAVFRHNYLQGKPGREAPTA